MTAAQDQGFRGRETRSARIWHTGASFAVGAVLSLLTQVLVVRVLGAEEYGAYAAIISAIALVELTVLNRGGEVALVMLGKSWVEGGGAGFADLMRALYWSDARWLTGAFVLVGAISIPLSWILSIEPGWVLLASLSLVVQIGYGADKSQLIVMGRIAQLAQAEIIVSVATMVASIAMVLSFGVVGLLAAYPVTAGVKMLIARRLAWKARADLPAGPPAGSRASLGLALEGASMLRNLFNAIAEQGDIVLVGMLGGGLAAGQYKIAKSLASLPARIVGPIWSAYRPELVDGWYGTERYRLRGIVGRSSTIMALLGALGIPVAWFVAPWFIGTFYGIDGAAVAVPFVILLGASWVLAAVVGWYRFLVLLDQNKYRSLLWSALVALWILGAGFMGAGETASSMAWVVAIGQVSLAVAACVWFLRQTSVAGRV